MRDEFLNKISEIVKNHIIIGDYVFSDDELAEMLDFLQGLCGKYLCGSIPSVDKKYNELIFVILVQIAKNWKTQIVEGASDSGFWEYIYRTITGSDVNEQKLYGLFTGIIRSLGASKKIIISNKGKIFYGTIMMHALSPRKSIFSFLDLCYNIYKKDLDFQFIEESDDDICLQATYKLKDVVERGWNDLEGVSIGSSVYALQIGIKALTSILDNEEDWSALFDLFRAAFMQIDSLFHGHDVKTCFDGFFKILIKEWWEKKQLEIGADKRTARQTKAVDEKHITVSYKKESGNIILIVPPIRLEYGNKDVPWIIVYGNNGKKLVSEELWTRESEIATTTKERKFNLNEWQLENDIDIKVEISRGKEILYDSKDQLNRTFILFNDEKEETKQICRVGNYFVYSLDIDSLQHPQERAVSQNLYNIYPQDGEILASNTKQVIFKNTENEQQGKNIIDLIGKLHGIEYVNGGTSFYIYNKDIKLLVAKNKNLNGLELMLNSNKYLLSDFGHTDADDFCVFDLTKIIKNEKETRIAIYSHYDSKYLYSESIILLNGIDIKFNQKWYYGDTEKEFSIHYKDISESFRFTNQQDSVSYSLLNGKIVANIPFIKWRIDNKEWNNEPLRKLFWYKDRMHNLHNGSILEFELPITLDIKIGCLCGGNLSEIVVDKNKAVIGQPIFSNESKDELLLFATIENKTLEIAIIALKEKFIAAPLIFQDNKLCWRPKDCFVGDMTRTFAVDFIYDGKILPLDGQLSLKDDVINGLNDNIYEYKIKTKSINRFIKDEAILYQGIITVGKPEQFKFKNKRIEILSVNCDVSDENTDLWKRLSANYGIDSINYHEEDEQSYYIGKLYYLNPYGKKVYLDSLPNSYNNFQKINPVRIELRNNNSFWLVAGYNGGNNFLGELIYDKDKMQICNIDRASSTQYVCINLYKFKEAKDV